ncbi:unnamed protein product [Bursaphelenchus okinawaensis]|uniref:3'(2'),5'-bisphosphate nucleotidase 1 n=1 Tax=Bursaphelenchus okinawaensis TaxID=465554 RepID=A0A811K5Y4_9BILA|nr:unnamed protein product [Bursaphelenchus okinawaensis]CAG9093450.1 unnamed protein product [Bursaphelenchus okinawaensis]
MFQKAAVLTRLVASSVKIAQKAGNVIKAVTATADLKIVDKGKNGELDIQTEADRSAQYCIEKSLQTKFDNKLVIIGEEEVTSAVPDLELDVDGDVLKLDGKLTGELRDAKLEDFVVWVDPLDGTSEFAKAVKTMSDVLVQVTVLIGICYKGRSVGGVIHQPFYGNNGRTIWGIVGVGTYGVHVLKATEKKVIVTTRSHLTPQVTRALDTLKGKGLCDEVKQVGGAGFKVLQCLDGATAYVFASAGCKKWDTAGPEACLRAAGGDLTDISGRNLCYDAHVQHLNSGGVLATAPGVSHADYVNAITDDLKKELPEIVSKQ